jgi:hypothetical protein
MKKDLKWLEIENLVENIFKNYLDNLGEVIEDEDDKRLLWDCGVIEKNFKDKNELIDDMIEYLLKCK